MWDPARRRLLPGRGTVIAFGDMAAIRAAFVDERIAWPYLAGYARALQQGAALETEGGRVTIWFPEQGK